MTTTTDRLVLPARTSFVPHALDSAHIAVMPFPFMGAVQSLLQAANGGGRVYAPWRQLDNALLACTPTLTGGFSQGWESPAIVVARPGDPLNLPDPTHLQDLLVLWARRWMTAVRRQRPDLSDDADTLLDAAARAHLKWDEVKPEALAFNPEDRGHLGYRALPALLTAMLHDQVTLVGTSERAVHWRRVLTRAGTFLVSRPFKANFTDEYGRFRQGYFAYRLDFSVQTQTGRVHPDAPHVLRPWVFLNLSVQRYAYRPLERTNFGRNVSILLGLERGLLPGSPMSSALVQLQAEPPSGGRPWRWGEQLPDVLADFKARPLVPPANILAEPGAFADLNGTGSAAGDEYLVVHAEGYAYGDESGKGHPVKTGYSLHERGAVLAGVLEALEGVLEPDGPLVGDRPAPKGTGKPWALRTHEDLAKPPGPSSKLTPEQERERQDTHRAERRSQLTSAISRALQGQRLTLYLLWHEGEMLELARQELRAAFLLHQGEPFPEGTEVIEAHVPNPELLAPLAIYEATTEKQRTEAIRRAHNAKREDWRAFLRTLPQGTGARVALIEIGSGPRKGLRPDQGIRGAVREACAREGIASQMLRSVTGRATRQGEATKEFKARDVGRAHNATLDLVLRQTGTLLGEPAEAHARAGLPADLAADLDVIALYRRRVNGNVNLHYALAVRLAADGQVDIRLPGQDTWIPYVEAGPELGRIFAQGRGELSGKFRSSQLRMSNADLARFAASIVTQPRDRPTVVVLEADGWRDGRSPETSIWPQLKNDRLWADVDQLDFQHVREIGGAFDRSEPLLGNLLGVVRLRRGQETPQYVTGRTRWDNHGDARALTALSGFHERTSNDVLHYYSVGRLPVTQKRQNVPAARGLSKLDSWFNPTGASRFDIHGANVAFKHQHVLEMVPFFMHPRLAAGDGRLALCRVLHYLRITPAWNAGNTSLPYPLHLAETLLADQLCIVGVHD